MKKRLVSLALILALLLSLCACGSKEPDSETQGDTSETVKITYWTASDSSDLQALLEQFRLENPNIEVEHVFVPYANAQTDYMTAFKSGQGPDVCELIQSWVPPLVEDGYLTDLNELIASDVAADDYYQIGWDAFVHGGSTYAMPTRLGIEAMYYNRALLELAGFSEPPQTWEEFERFGEELAKHGKYAYGVTAANKNDLAYRFLSWYFTAGAEIADEGWKTCLMNTEEAIDALTFETNLYKNGYAPESGVSDGSGDVYLMFMANEVATMIRGPLDMFSILKDDATFYEENLIITSMPKYADDVPTATASYVYGLGMNSALEGAKAEAAWKLVQFLSQPENITKISYGDLPARVSALDCDGPVLAGDECVNYRDSLYAAFLDQAANARVIPTHAEWAEISEVIWNNYQSILAGQTDATTAANQMTSEIQTLLDS